MRRQGVDLLRRNVGDCVVRGVSNEDSVALDGDRLEPTLESNAHLSIVYKEIPHLSCPKLACLPGHKSLESLERGWEMVVGDSKWKMAEKI